MALVAGIAGHGDGPYGNKQFPGVLAGKGDVVWFAQDYPNLIKVVWNEEIIPRFGDRHRTPYARTNENEMRLELPDLKSSLYLQSAEAIGNVRGMGKTLRGVIIDEAAWLNLGHALKAVILPTLVDNDGWLIVMSTTNCALDGNTEKVVPSYFNRMVEDIKAGKMGPNWGEWYGTVFDNPMIKRDVAQEWVDTYTDGDLDKEQEVLANLVKPGGGAALRELDRDVHVVRPFKPAHHWKHIGAFDWGFNHPFFFGYARVDEDGNIYLIDSVTGRDQQPNEIAMTLKTQLGTETIGLIERIDCGHDVWAEKRSHSDNVPTIAEQFMAQGITRLVQASIDRVQGLNNMRAYLQWQPRGVEGEPGFIKQRTPRFVLFDTPTNRQVFDGLDRMVLDPKKPEDVLKVDAVSGRGGDDAYDMTRYLLASRPLHAIDQEPRELDDVNAPEVLLAEYEKLRRMRTMKPPRAPQRAITELDPDFGEN